VDWYNSLTDYYSGAPEDFWDVLSDLCGQNGVTCDDSTPYQRIIKLLNFSFIFFFYFHFFLSLNIEIEKWETRWKWMVWKGLSQHNLGI